MPPRSTLFPYTTLFRSEVRDKFTIHLNAEITMEMNPATVTPEALRHYRFLGVNRASFGVQTFNDRALKLLARRSEEHTSELQSHSDLVCRLLLEKKKNR